MSLYNRDQECNARIEEICHLANIALLCRHLHWQSITHIFMKQNIQELT